MPWTWVFRMPCGRTCAFWIRHPIKWGSERDYHIALEMELAWARRSLLRHDRHCPDPDLLQRLQTLLHGRHVAVDRLSLSFPFGLFSRIRRGGSDTVVSASRTTDRSIGAISSGRP